MKTRAKNVIGWFVAGLLVLSALAGFEVLNFYVSLKYETDGPGECVSQITQVDLCLYILVGKILCVGSLLLAGLISLLAYLKRDQW